MPTWKNLSMDSFTQGEPWPCEVRISVFEIVVSYQDDNRQISYKGKELAPGHFELSCAETGGTASLHRSPDSEWLEGSWSEGEEQGMWRIRLGEGEQQA